MSSNYYIQYHNADKLGTYPTQNTDFKTSVELLTLDNSVKNKEPWIYTSKKIVEKAVKQSCFLIVGKTDKIKKYYLWSFFKIKGYEQDESGIYDVSGTGYDFEKPILLNELEHFNDFKIFCGNFGIGFQNIDNHLFHSTLVSLEKHPYFGRYKSVSLAMTAEIINEPEITSPDLLVTEGRSRLVSHLKKERNRKIIKEKKEQAIKSNTLHCEVCNFSFSKTYQSNFIECHHLSPIGQLGVRETKLEDLALVCANCHRMLHTKFDGQYLSIQKLQARINLYKQSE